MARWDQGLLTAGQSAFVEHRLGRPHLREDFSWGLTDTRVLRAGTANGDVIVKAAGPHNTHIGREITAYEKYTRPLSQQDRTGTLIDADRGLNILIVSYQPGELAAALPAENDSDTHRQAGRILRTLHAQHSRVDAEYEHRATAKALSRLDHENRIAGAVEAEARTILTTYRPQPVKVVPTHGDWHPRNWLLNAGQLRVIDFGRFDFRPAATDLCRLAVQQWRTTPSLEAHFLAGYGTDPRTTELWSIDLLREAIGTAVWAFEVGDAEFESQGHRMLSEALDRF